MRPPRTDQELVERARQGDTTAFEGLVDRHHGAVHAIALARLRDADAAQDLAQEVFLRSWLHLAGLRDGGRYGAWVCRMARNLAANRLRSGARHSALVRMVPMNDEVSGQVAAPDPGPAAHAEQRDREARVQAALAKLDPEERELVMLHFQDQVSQRDLAARLGVHHTTVGRRLERSLGRLRGLLGEEPAREAMPRAPEAAKAATMALILAAASMPAGARAALVAASADTAAAKTGIGGAASVLPGLLQSTSAALAAGVQAMTLAQKITMGAAAVVLVAGGTYFYQAQAGPGGAGPAGTESSTTASSAAAARSFIYDAANPEQVLEIATGETVAMEVDEELFDAARMELTALPGGMLELRVSGARVNETLVVPASSGDPREMGKLTSVQVWEERNRVMVKSIFVEKTEAGLRLHLFARNNPALLGPLKTAEKAHAEGRISERQLVAFAEKVLTENGMLPTHPGNRQLVLNVVRGGL